MSLGEDKSSLWSFNNIRLHCDSFTKGGGGEGEVVELSGRALRERKGEIGSGTEELIE